jgi:serine/threonine protein kinase
MQPSFGTLSTYPQPGEVLDGKYRVEHLLGEGGMGAVAKATHLLRRAPVALKFMSGAVLSLQGAVERFVNEGVAASQIDSDHVVKIFDVGRLPSGAPYLVMEYLEGFDLAQLLEREGPKLDTSRAVHFTVQALRALHTAHGAGIIHRDMKPSNCFVIAKDGEPDFVKLVDFGISKVRASEDGGAPQLTRTNSALGTPLYMSPEQARSPRDVDHRTDLYSVGAILYEMLAGRTPYSAGSGEYTEMLFKIFTTEPEPLGHCRPDLPEALTAVVARALHRDRNERFASAADMAEALAPFADERSAQVLARLRAGRRSHRPAVVGSVVPANAPAIEVPARTFPGSESSTAPPPPTGVGVTRVLRSGAGSTAFGKTGIGIAIAAVALLAAATGIIALRARSGANRAIGEPTAPTEVARESALPTLSAGRPPEIVSAPPAVVLAPESTAVLSPSASPSARAVATSPKPLSHPTAAASVPAPPSTSSLPTQLGDLKLH